MLQLKKIRKEYKTGDLVQTALNDVSLNLRDDAQSSILNRLPVRVLELVDTDTAAHVLVRLDAGGNPLLARITRYSRDQLQLRPGQLLWAQIKSVAVLA